MPIEARIAALPAHARPPMRELGRRSEAANHPFKRAQPTVLAASQPGGMTALHAPLALSAKVGRRDEIVAACPAANARGVTIGMAATHARALVSDLDIRPAEPEADHAVLDRLALLAVRRSTPIAEVSQPDGLWLDLTGTDHLHGGEAGFCRRLQAFCGRAGYTARVAIADTPGAAHAVARFGPADVTLVASGRTIDALGPLPVAALRLENVALGAAQNAGRLNYTGMLQIRKTRSDELKA